MKTKLKVGDRVMAINRYQERDNTAVEPGETGIFVHYHPDKQPDFGVEWDNRGASRHDCDRHCENGYGYYVPRDCIMKIPKNISKKELNKLKLVYVVL